MLQQFRTKVKIVKAIMWTGDVNILQDFIESKEYGKSWMYVDSAHEEIWINLDKDSSKMKKVRINDYIVKDSNGNLYPMSYAAFQEEFEPY